MAKHTTPMKHQWLEQMPEDAEADLERYSDEWTEFLDAHPEFDDITDAHFAFIWQENRP